MSGKQGTAIGATGQGEGGATEQGARKSGKLSDFNPSGRSGFQGRQRTEDRKDVVEIREMTGETVSESENPDGENNMQYMTFMLNSHGRNSNAVDSYDPNALLSGGTPNAQPNQVKGGPTGNKKHQVNFGGPYQKRPTALPGGSVPLADELLSGKKPRPTQELGPHFRAYESSGDKSGISYEDSNSQDLYGEESSYSESMPNSLHSSRRTSMAKREKRSKTLTNYSLLMINFIPATIIHQLTHLDTKQQQAEQNFYPGLSSAALVKQGAEHDPGIQYPLQFQISSVVLVAEFTNFYDENAELEFRDKKFFNEHLVSKSSKFLEIVSSCLEKYGGDLIQFMGYSLVAIWPDYLESQRQSNAEGDGGGRKSRLEFIRDVARKAAQCALDARRDIQKYMGTQVRVIFGICHGDFQVLHMGGILKRIEYFVSGPAYQNALSVMRASRRRRGTVDVKQSDQNIACTFDTWNYIKDFFVGNPSQFSHHTSMTLESNLLDSKGGANSGQPDFYFIHQTQTSVKLSRSNYLQKQQIDERKIQRVQIHIKSYIPAAFRHFAHIQDDRLLHANGSHLKQSVIAMAIELNQDSLNCTTKHQLNLLQSVIEIIQMQVYRMEGSINRILTYVGGLIVLASWGTGFLNHTDEAPRAVYAALNVKKELIKFQQDFMVEDDTNVEPPIHIGIATGDTYQGIVGRFNKKEVVSIGTVFERAYLLMQTAVKHYGKIYVDFNTRLIANHFIDFHFVEMLEFSHKTLNESIFKVVGEQDSQGVGDKTLDKLNKSSVQDLANAPSNALDEKSKARLRAMEIRIHANPFFQDRDNNYQSKFCETYGRLDIITSICDDIAEYIQQYEMRNVWILAIRGPVGSGKSLFARRLMLESSYRERTLLKPLLEKNQYKFRFEFVVSNCTCNVQMTFIGAWRPFLQTLLSIYSENLRQSREYTMNSQIQFSNVEDKVDIIEAIFDLKNLARSKSQTAATQKRSNQNIKTSMTPQSSVGNNLQNQQKGMGRNRRQMSSSMMDLEGERYEDDFEDSIILFCLDFILQALEELRHKCCFFVVFDNVSMMNITSWKLFDLVSTQPNLLILSLCLQTVDKYFETVDLSDQVSSLQFKIFDQEETRSYYKRYIKPREREIFNIADMTPIPKASFKKALIDLSQVYERDINQQIEDLTKIMDTTTSEKTFTEQKKIALLLQDRYQAQSHFTNIDDEVMDQIMAISLGNPLTAFWFTYQAMLGNFVTIKDFTLVPTLKFRASLAVNDWTVLELPWPLFKQNQVQIQASLLDSKFQHTNVKHMFMMFLLQTAAIIGDNFSMLQLDSVNKRFLGSQSQQLQTTATLLHELEQRDLIEFLYGDAMSNDKFYRFVHPFTRATIYQSMPWEQKVKDIHRKIIDYMRDTVTFDYTTGWSLQKEYTIMMRHVMSSERVFIESELSQKARQTLVIKKINQRLMNNQKKAAIFSGHVGMAQDDLKDLLQNTHRNKIKVDLIFINLKQHCLELLLVDLKNKPMHFLATIALDCIIQVEIRQPSKKKDKKNSTVQVEEKQAFAIKCSRWSRYDPRKQAFNSEENAKFEFTVPDAQGNAAASNILREHDVVEWSMALEYLKAKKSYDNFTESFGKANFAVPRINENLMSSTMQKKEVGSMPNDLDFAKQFQSYIQVNAQGQINQNMNQLRQALPPHVLGMYEETQQSEEGGASAKQANRLRRRSTILARNHLNQVANSKASAIEEKAKRLNTLSKKLLCLYNIAAVGFNGHMQTCALKDSKQLEEEALGLGKISAIDSQIKAQSRKSIRRRTVSGLADAGLSVQTQIQMLIRRCLPLKSVSASQNSLLTQSTAMRMSQLRFIDAESSTETMTERTVTEQDQDPETTSQATRNPFQEAPNEALEHSMSQNYQTMTGQTAEQNLFTEERSAQRIGRTRPGPFQPGRKIGISNMCLQEKLDGDLGHFKLQRRHDRIGYNKVMTPFIQMNSSNKNLHTTYNSQISLRNTTPHQFASSKSLGVHSQKIQSTRASHKDLSDAVTGFSISAAQNGALLPKNTRTAKGIAIEKILEGTQKPWFMITGREYNKPSPFNDRDPKMSKRQPEVAQIEEIDQSHSQQDLIQDFILDDQSAADSSANRLGQNQLLEQQVFDHLDEHEESKDEIGRLSNKSKSHHNRTVMSENIAQSECISHRSEVRRTPHMSSAKPSSYKTSIKHQSNQNHFSERHSVPTTPTVGGFEQQTTPHSTAKGSKRQSIAPQSEEGRQAHKQSSHKQASAAVILFDQIPFAVLQDHGRVQLTAEQVDFSLNTNDVIQIEKDIQERDGTPSKLSQGYCVVDGKQVCIVLPKQCFKLLPAELSSHNTFDHWPSSLTMQKRSSEDGLSSHLVVKSPSQVLSRQVYRKVSMEDSADRLLSKSPTELGIVQGPPQQQLEAQYSLYTQQYPQRSPSNNSYPPTYQPHPQQSSSPHLYPYHAQNQITGFHQPPHQQLTPSSFHPTAYHAPFPSNTSPPSPIAMMPQMQPFSDTASSQYQQSYHHFQPQIQTQPQPQLKMMQRRKQNAGATTSYNKATTPSQPIETQSSDYQAKPEVPLAAFSKMELRRQRKELANMVINESDTLAESTMMQVWANQQHVPTFNEDNQSQDPMKISSAQK